MASRQPNSEVSVGRPEKAITGSLAECVEIRLGDYKVGYIQFVRREPLLTVIGGGLDAPVIQPTGKRGKRQAEVEGDEGEPAEAPLESSAQASIQQGQVRATQALLGPRGAVRFGAAVTALLDGDREAARGITWEQAFKRAATDAGIWQEACSALARGQKREVFVPSDKLTQKGLEVLEATVERQQIRFEDRDGKLSEPVDGFSIFPR